MECESASRKMVATLQSRKDALEAKLREKTLELKKLCIQEAELTGILPPETPIEPGESPPVFRRKVGTAFAYPENLIDKLKSKEEEALARLELECKIQTSIAEAALGLANDGNASKSIRRKHRLEYQRSQRRLAELEMRLSVLRQSIKSSSSQFQRKKPRPPIAVDSVADCTDGLELGSDELDAAHFQHTHADEPSSLSFINRDIIRNSHFYNSFGKSLHNYPSYVHHQTYQPPNKNGWSRNQLYRRSVGRTHHNSDSYVLGPINGGSVGDGDGDGGAGGGGSGANENGAGGPTCWLEDSSLWRNTAPVGYFSNQCYTTLPSHNNRMKSRYGSLDRRHRTTLQNGTIGGGGGGAGGGGGGGSVTKIDAVLYASGAAAARISPTLSCSNQRSSPNVYRSSRSGISSPSDSAVVNNAVLLPNQTYPENSLMRTQSLGNVEQPRKSLDTHSLQEKVVPDSFQCGTLGRRTREKEWRETSLDADCYDCRGQTPPLHPRRAAKMTGLPPESPIPQRPFSRRSAHTPPPPLPPPHGSIIAAGMATASAAVAPLSPPPSPPPPLLPPPSTTSISCKSPVKSPTLIESSVPFESPKNHTVVEVGKWQPYREVTKPFEMSDFYKYSTKFRKNNE